MSIRITVDVSLQNQSLFFALVARELVSIISLTVHAAPVDPSVLVVPVVPAVLVEPPDPVVLAVLVEPPDPVVPVVPVVAADPVISVVPVVPAVLVVPVDPAPAYVSITGVFCNEQFCPCISTGARIAVMRTNRGILRCQRYVDAVEKNPWESPLHYFSKRDE